MNFAFVDIGELGWSLHISAHVRWLKKNTNSSVAVIALTDRKCLYEGLADIILDIPKIFFNKFDSQKQDCFSLRRTLAKSLSDFFASYIPAGYSIPDYFIFDCRLRFGNKVIYEPYKYSKSIEGDAEILIFPRFRPGDWKYRNLPEIFYIQLIERLCDEFPELMIRTIGALEGAYNIQIEKLNYVNWVGKGESIQDFIDRCQLAVAAVGSQSALPKISLLQGVPTFMIGHDLERHVTRDNWSHTKAGFYLVPKMGYATINQEDCINKVIGFIKSYI